MFLGIILNIIIAILFGLSLLLLYNLLLISIETKNFEIAVFRTLGLNKIGVVSLILIQSLSYVIPAVILGLLCSFLGLYGINSALNSAIAVQISIYPTPNAILMALVVGTIIPLISSIIPIREALNK